VGSVFQGGGAGAAILTGATAIPTMDTMIMATHMATAMATDILTTAMATGTVTDMVVTGTGTDTATTTATIAKIANTTAVPLGRAWLSYNGDSPGLAIITGQSTEFLGLRRDGQFEPTSPTMGTQTQVEPGPLN
jgi:hypothetical protein